MTDKPLLSREEILDNNIAFWKTDFMSSPFKRKFEKAMSEYAEQTAIDFVEFVNARFVKYDNKRKTWIKWIESDDKKQYTLDQIYKLYTNSKTETP